MANNKLKVTHPPEEWLEQKDSISFLIQNDLNQEFVVYAAANGVFIHSVLLPEHLARTENHAELLRWNCNPYDSWGVSFSSNSNPVLRIDPPLSGAGSTLLEQGEQLLFFRHFEGDDDLRHYVELSQRFSHSLDLHYVSHLRSYCTLNHLGDVQPIVRIEAPLNNAGEKLGLFVTIESSFMKRYATLTQSIIFRMFDFTRCPLGWGSWNPENEVQRAETDIEYRFQKVGQTASFARGFQFVRSPLTTEELSKQYWHGTQPKQYASFIAQDWKNKKVSEVSCDPKYLSDYFQKSDLPFDMSPAFFSPEVLLKYKTDRKKYNLKSRSITCRGAWHLQTYDINSEGQVHTYLKYLGQLPYEEQLHWKQFNELPAGPISDRAFRSDYEGSWDIEIDCLETLRSELRHLDQNRADWWRLISNDLLDEPHLPVTNSVNEWENEILSLDKLVVEGFRGKWLRNQSEKMLGDIEQGLGSLKLLEKFLLGLGFDAEIARATVAPLEELHLLRTKVKGHASGTEGEALRREALKKFGSYRAHYIDLCTRCLESIRSISKAERCRSAR